MNYPLLLLIFMHLTAVGASPEEGVEHTPIATSLPETKTTQESAVSLNDLDLLDTQAEESGTYAQLEPQPPSSFMLILRKINTLFPWSIRLFPAFYKMMELRTRFCRWIYQ